MSIDVRCPDCSQPYRVPATVAGKKIACKNCGGVIPVPAADSSEAAPKTAKPKQRARDPEDRPRRKRASGERASGGGSSSRRQKGSQRSSREDRSGRQRSGSGSRSERGRSAGRRRGQGDVVEDFEEVSDYDDPYSSDGFDDYDDLGDYGMPSRSKKKKKRDSTARWVRVGLIIFAVAICVRTIGFGASVIAQLMAQTGSRTTSADSVLMLFKVDLWTRITALTAMVVSYGFLVAGRDREGSQGWAIASIVLGAIATGAFFIMNVMPFLDDDQKQWLVRLVLVQAGLGNTNSLWDSVFEGWVLSALYLSHLVTATLFFRAWFHSDKVIPGRAMITLICLIANASALLLRGLLTIFIVKVIFPAAMEAREAPSEVWSYLNKGLHWIGMIAFLVFLIMAIRLVFGAISETR